MPRRISPRQSREPTPSPNVGSPNQVQTPAPIPAPQHEMELDIPPSPPPVEALLAARRAKRQEIVAKYSGTSQSDVSSLKPPSEAKTPQPVASTSDSVSVDAFDIVKHDEEEDAQIKVQAQNEGIHQISAADYDPNLDRREDEQRRIRDKETENEDETIEEEEDQEVDDIFAVAMAPKKIKKIRKVTVRKCEPPMESTLTFFAE
jgi:serine/threonine-protein kinase PRP4